MFDRNTYTTDYVFFILYFIFKKHNSPVEKFYDVLKEFVFLF